MFSKIIFRRILIIGALTVSLIALSVNTAIPVRASTGFANNMMQTLSVSANDGEVPLSRALSPNSGTRTDNPPVDIRSLKISQVISTGLSRHRRDPVDFAKYALHRYGWTDRSQFGCLYRLWEHESGWNKYASNPYSGAYGIPQADPGYKMAANGIDWPDDARVQIHWGLHYIKVIYGSPCAAWNHELAWNSYDYSVRPMTDSLNMVPIPFNRSVDHDPLRRLVAFRWALNHAKGCWYDWGGTTCQPGFDCSGVVMMSWLHAGVSLPRTTFDMLASRKLIWIPASQARRGDLAFFGSGHVELVAYKDRWTFGALDWGTRVGFHKNNSWWHPTAYYRIR